MKEAQEHPERFRLLCPKCHRLVTSVGNFLGHRARQHIEMAKDPRSAIIDRSIYEDAFIFARALHHMGNLNERDYLTYRQVFDLVVGTLPQPSLLITLKRRLARW